MDVDAQKLFTLVDAAYNQPITNQPSDSYRQALLAAAIDLNNNVSPQQVTIQLYQAYYRNYMVPMTLPIRSHPITAPHAQRTASYGTWVWSDCDAPNIWSLELKSRYLHALR